jgi:hypothetical protein
MAANFDFDLRVVLQESLAVVFHLVCLSRLGTNDYYYPVTQKDEYRNDINPAASLASESKLASTLVLFLTLLVFDLPYINVWLYLNYFIGYTDDTKIDIDSRKRKRIVTCVLVIVLYFAMTAAAWQFIKNISNVREGSVTWVVSADLSDYPDTKTNHLTEFFEELFAVFSLLVGVYYLVIDSAFTKIGFILKLTVLAAALFRAFPGTHLCPHISLYLVLMKFTNVETFLARSFGGLVGFGLALLYKRALTTPTLTPTPTPTQNSDSIYSLLLPDAEAGDGSISRVNTPRNMPRVPSVSTPRVQGTGLQGLKISFDGSRYF